jgi:hypothetical protein
MHKVVEEAYVLIISEEFGKIIPIVVVEDTVSFLRDVLNLFETLYSSPQLVIILRRRKDPRFFIRITYHIHGFYLLWHDQCSKIFSCCALFFS